jgi:D-alanyl-D-alanine carboxypeptidase
VKIYCIIFFLIFNSIIAHSSSKKASLVVDLNNGQILHADNAHAPRYPASLVKMMTLYITFDSLEKGDLSLDQKLNVSDKAAAMPRTNLDLKKGDKISVRKAILGLIVHSSNDAAVVLAEAIAGSEQKFVALMNLRAKKIGMNNSIFFNASGLPHKKQKSTAYDLAKLAIALKKDFPSFFPWFSVTSFSFNGKTYHSHNHVLLNYEWATGLKTGFTNASGFNVATTAHQNGKSLIGVVLGEKTSKTRDKYMINLLDNCFAKARKNDTIKSKK